MAQVIRILDGASVEVAQVAVAHPSLDEVFLKATGSRLEGAASAKEANDDGTG